MGSMTVRARVIEDRGHLGVGALQVVRIQVLGADLEEGEPHRFEMPAEEVVQEQPPARCTLRARFMSRQWGASAESARC